MLLYLKPLLNDIFDGIARMDQTPLSGSTDSHSRKWTHRLRDAGARAQRCPADRKIAILIRGIISHFERALRWKANTRERDHLIIVKRDFKDYMDALTQVNDFKAAHAN